MAVHVRADLALYHVETASYRSLALRSRRIPRWTISHVLEGLVRTETRGASATVRSGMVMVHPPDIPFDEHAAGPGTHQWLSLELDLGGVAALTRTPLPLVVPLGPSRDAYAETFAALERVWKSPASPSQPLACLSGVSGLLALLGRAWEESGLEPRSAALSPATDRFAPLVGYIDQHLGGKLTRDALAAQAFLHPNAFDRAFRAVHGLPPMRFVQQRRLERARHLLETTDETLDAIAATVGLGDASRLSRRFRSQFGVSPGALRRRVKSTRDGYIASLSDIADASTLAT